MWWQGILLYDSHRQWCSREFVFTGMLMASTLARVYSKGLGLTPSGVPGGVPLRPL